jgi:SPP1 gp7 family putative phage head morphogenesis protein
LIVTLRSKDPTSTVMLRKAFSTQMTKRFNYIKSLSNQSIVRNDCFSLANAGSASVLAALDYIPAGGIGIPHQDPIPYKAFEFSTNSEKMASFMAWLKEVTKNVIYQEINPADPNITYWDDVYIKTSYAKGMKWARGNLRRDSEVFNSLDEFAKASLGTDDTAIKLALNGPVSVDRLKTLYLRAFTDLQGITGDMDAAISRVLANGFASGWSPTRIASDISDSIDHIGKHRGVLLARSEVIRAHHLASIQEYREAGVVGVKVLAEWTTARDSRVCQRCEGLDFKATGKLWTLDAIEPMIPLHPQCRCAALPSATLV